MPRLRALRAPFLFFAIVGLLTVSASAEIITYSGYDLEAWSGGPRPNSDAAAASFDAANPGLPIITFESAPPTFFNVLYFAPDVTLQANFQLISNDPGGRTLGFNTTSGGSQWLRLQGEYATFTFASPINAFGAYLSGTQWPGAVFMFGTSTFESIAIPTLGSPGGVQFLGFSDTSPFSTVIISAASNDQIGVDDVRYGSAGSEVPEPATFGLLGAALAGLGFLRRRLS